jgi:hypothetical protein
MPESLFSVTHDPDTDGMRLLDYVGSVLGWHPDWLEARPSVWHELPAFADLAPALFPAVAEVEAVMSRPEHSEMQLGISIPAPVEHDVAANASHVNYCGGCFQRFEATDAVTAANALRHHIEAEPCAHYPSPFRAVTPRVRHSA